jgi:hypothetical protein
LEKEGAILAGPVNSVADATRQLREKVNCAVLDVNLGNETVAPVVRELEASRILMEKANPPVLWRTWPIFNKPVSRVDVVDAIVRLVLRSRGA